MGNPEAAVVADAEADLLKAFGEIHLLALILIVSHAQPVRKLCILTRSHLELITPTVVLVELELVYVPLLALPVEGSCRAVPVVRFADFPDATLVEIRNHHVRF